MTEWSVQVNGVGVIGTVEGDIEWIARREALIRFGKAGPRPKKETLPSPYIYEDDDFAVIKLSYEIGMIQIKNRFTDQAILGFDADQFDADQMEVCIEAPVKSGADLSGADLARVSYFWMGI